MINRRGFIALSVAAAAVPVIGLGEVWFHRGVLVTVKRNGRKVKMYYEVNGAQLGLGATLNDEFPQTEQVLRRAVGFSIDNLTGHTERMLAKYRRYTLEVQGDS